MTASHFYIMGSFVSREDLSSARDQHDHTWEGHVNHAVRDQSTDELVMPGA
jgi:hypothetical protein